MKKFNRYLSALEATHLVAPPVVEVAKPLYVSDFIHYIFENNNDFGLNGLDKEWFCQYSNKLPQKALSLVSNLLEERGHIVSRKSLVEGIETFSKEETDEA